MTVTRNVLNHNETVELTTTIQKHAAEIQVLKTYDEVTDLLNGVLTFKATKDNVRNRCRSLRILPLTQPNRYTQATNPDMVTRLELKHQIEKLRAEFQDKLNAGRVVYTSPKVNNFASL